VGHQLAELGEEGLLRQLNRLLETARDPLLLLLVDVGADTRTR
jgi:hypothetical protein